MLHFSYGIMLNPFDSVMLGVYSNISVSFGRWLGGDQGVVKGSFLEF